MNTQQEDLQAKLEERVAMYVAYDNAFCRSPAHRRLALTPRSCLLTFSLLYFTRFYSNSIYAQRTVERLFVKQDEVISRRDNTYAAQPMIAVAHPDVKNTAAGERSSYEGAVAYAADAVARRDELLAKYASP
jgi:hypothetical protein